jgi:hypothetical protein
MTDALVIVDMPAGSFAPTSPPRHDAADGVASEALMEG